MCHSTATARASSDDPLQAVPGASMWKRGLKSACFFFDNMRKMTMYERHHFFYSSHKKRRPHNTVTETVRQSETEIVREPALVT